LQSSVLFKPSFKKLIFGLGPGVLIYGFMVVVPLLYAIDISFYIDINYKFKYAGLANYIALVADPEFWHSFENNLLIIVINAFLQIGLAFVVALLMNSKMVKAKRFIRIFIFFPVILTPIVVAFLWTLIYDYNEGILNVVLKALNLAAYVQNWLVNPKIVMYAVIAPMTWQYLGLFVVIFLAGLTSIPQDLIEQAEIDGASGWQKTMHIILPLMANTWKVILVLSTANGIKVFETPFAMTRGGPGVASSVLAIFAYNQSFLRSKIAYGSTVAIGMLIITLILIGIVTFLFNYIFVRRRGYEK
jgi:raffinose/stachyose/melibiose transport system permease protein